MKSRIGALKAEMVEAMVGQEPEKTYAAARRFLKGAKAEQGKKSRVEAMAHRCIGICLRLAGRAERAEREFAKALEIAKGGGCPPVSMDLSLYLKDLAMVQYGKGRQEEADALFVQAGMIGKVVAPPDDSLITGLLLNCADCGDDPDGDGKVARAIWLAESVYGIGHPACVALEKLTERYTQDQCFAEAKGLLRHLAGQYQHLFGPESYAQADACFRLAGYLDEDDPAERVLAMECCRTVLAAQNALYLPDVEQVMTTEDRLASCLEAAGEKAEAEGILMNLLALVREFGPKSPHLPDILGRLAEIHLDKKDYAKATAEQEEAVALERKIGNGEKHAERLFVLGRVYEERSKHQNRKYIAKGISAYRHSLRLAEKYHGRGHLHVACVLDNLANLTGFAGRAREAIALYRRSLGIRRREQGLGDVNTAETMHDMALQHLTLNEYRKARTLLRRAFASMTSQKDLDRARLIPVLNALGITSALMGNLDVGVVHLEQALRGMENLHGVEDPQLITHQQNLAGLLALAGRKDEAERFYRRAILLAKSRPMPHDAELKELESELKAVRDGAFRKPVDRFWLMEAGSAA